MLSGFILSVALSATTVPPGALVEDHSQPYHWTQPTLRRFRRRPVDDYRRASWDAYVQELDLLWKDYRAANSTRPAFRAYQHSAAQAKRRYVINDPYLAPIEPNVVTIGPDERPLGRWPMLPCQEQLLLTEQ